MSSDRTQLRTHGQRTDRIGLDDRGVVHHDLRQAELLDGGVERGAQRRIADAITRLQTTQQALDAILDSALRQPQHP
jgi:hypothetical protein